MEELTKKIKSLPRFTFSVTYVRGIPVAGMSTSYDKNGKYIRIKDVINLIKHDGNKKSTS